MTDKIFLLKNKNSFSLNKPSLKNISLERNERLMSSTDLSETIGLYDLYNEERDKCNKFRFIFTINPICSNVLFNSVTEIIKDEGSDECEVISSNSEEGLNRLTAIRNTEFSSDDISGLTYHCGYDIFNNHILRANNFPFIGKRSSEDKYDAGFNTFCDYARDENGTVIKMLDYQSTTGNKEIDCHVYNMDTLDNLSEAFASKCIEKEGWFGFENKALIDIPNYDKGDKKLTINKVINNKQACSFIDLYPDRSLFSFEPKYNKYRMRIEKNWDYCLTYPFESDFEKFNKVNDNDKNAMKIYSYEVGYTNNGDKLIRFKSLFKHNLKKGDYINLYITDEFPKQGELKSPKQVGKKIVIRSLGDATRANQDKIFNVRYDDIAMFCVEKDGKLWKRFGNICDLFFKKLSNGCECEYYFRKFKKFSYQAIDGNNGKINTEPHSEINKLSFAKNIYGDNLTQIVFTDDINVDGLVDNLGRDLSTIYLTIIKRNKGHEEWYEDQDYKNEKVEFSHCFGKVTSGIDLPNDYTDYNIHKLHNIDLSFKNFTNSKSGEETIGYDVNNNAIIQPDLDKLQESSKTKVDTRKHDEPNVFKNIDKEEFESYKGMFEKINKDYTKQTEIKINYSTYSDGTKAVFSNFLKQPKVIDDDITIDNIENGFYGDIVEFNKATFNENIVDYVYHRFNTAQREYTKSDEYADIREDYIVYDDFFGTGFTTASTFVNLVDYIDGKAQSLYLGNLNPEGYFYNPNYGARIKDISSDLSSVNAEGIYYNEELYGKEGGITKESKTLKIGNLEYTEYVYDEYTIPYTEDYNFKVGDKIAFYNLNEDKTVWGYVTMILPGVIKVQTEKDAINDDYFKIAVEMIFRIPGGCPDFARFILSNETYVWRNVVLPSKLNVDSELYDTTFSNGAFYFEKNINFFLRRQDPHGEYYMSNPEENPQVPVGFASEARKYKKFSIGKFNFEGIIDINDLFNSSCE